MKHCNTFVMILLKNKLRVLINNSEHLFDPVPKITSLSHLCIVLKMSSMKYYVNGSEYLPRTNGGNAANIPGGGVLIFGQDQDGNIDEDSPGNPNDENQGFNGEMQGLHVWKRALNTVEIRHLNQSRCNCVNDSLITISAANTILREIVGYDITCGWYVWLHISNMIFTNPMWIFEDKVMHQSLIFVTTSIS